jgi:hypothetical protein
MEKCQGDLAFLRSHLQILADVFGKLCAYHREFSERLRSFVKLPEDGSSFVTELHRLTMSDLNEARSELRHKQEEIDDLQSVMQTLVNQVRILELEKQQQSSEMAIISASSHDQKKQIDELSGSAVRFRDEAYRLRQRLSELELRSQNLGDNGSSITTMLSGPFRSNVAVVSRSFVQPFLIFHFVPGAPPEGKRRRGFSMAPRAPRRSPPMADHPRPTSVPLHIVDLPTRGWIEVPHIEHAEKEVARKAKTGHETTTKPIRVKPAQEEPLIPVGQSSQANFASRLSGQHAEKVSIRVQNGKSTQVVKRPFTPKVVIPRTNKRVSGAPFDVEVESDHPPTETGSTVEIEYPLGTGLVRTLSFEELVPISEDDTTGCLIGYITRYVPLEKESIMISEVPETLLRPHEELKQRSLIVTAATGLKPDEKAELLDVIRDLEKRLIGKSSELQAEKEKVHQSVQLAFSLKTELIKARRAQRKNALLHETTKKRLGQALGLVSAGDNEILRLRKALKGVRQVTGVVEERAKVGTDAEARDALELEDRLIAAFRGASSGLSGMAIRQAEEMRKWKTKRDSYLEAERMRAMRSLEGMNWTVYGAREQSHSAIRVTSWRPVVPKRWQLAAKPSDGEEDVPTYEAAVKMAASRNQKPAKVVREGIVPEYVLK